MSNEYTVTDGNSEMFSGNSEMFSEENELAEKYDVSSCATSSGIMQI